MMNIILIEDEPPILRSLQGHIGKFEENFIVKGAFTNARDALLYLEKEGQEVDVAITDIELPLINGLEFIEQLKNQYSHISCIIISGYDKFEYARTALRLGVTDYLSKPVDTMLLHKCLLTIYKTKCMESMIHPGAAELEHSVSTFSKDYIVAVICDGNYSYFSTASQSEDYDFEHQPQDLYQLLGSTTQMDYKIAAGKSSFEFIVFLHLEPEQGVDSLRKVQSFFSTLLHQSSNFTVVYSGVPSKLGEMGTYLQNIRYCLYKSIIIGKSQLIHYLPDKWLEPQFQPDALDSELYHLERIFLEANLPLFKQELQRFLTLLQDNAYTQGAVFYYLNQLAYACLSKQPKSRPNILIPQLINDVVFYARNYETLYENLLSVFLDYLREDNLNKSSTLEKIDYYIKQHYMEPINTSQLADAFNFTPSYLSKIFREYKNSSPIEYILTLKIEKAKAILTQNPSLPIKECAALIGYSDPLYFSKVFKKVTGLSPKQFLLQMQGKN